MQLDRTGRAADPIACTHAIALQVRGDVADAAAARGGELRDTGRCV